MRYSVHRIFYINTIKNQGRFPPPHYSSQSQARMKSLQISLQQPRAVRRATQGFMLKQVHTSEHLTTYVWPSDVHTYLHHQRPLRGRSTYLLTVRLRIRYLKSLGAAASTYLLAKFSAASRPKYILTYVRVKYPASTCCFKMKPRQAQG